MRVHSLRLVTVACVAALGAAIGCAGRMRARPAEWPQYLSVSGVVVLEATGRPFANARIRVYTTPLRETMSDARGYYRIDSLPWGDHKVVADGVGLIREERSIQPSCTVSVVDSVGRVLTPGHCTDPDERLNFSMRPMRMHGR